jgi:hypothetical protein
MGHEKLRDERTKAVCPCLVSQAGLEFHVN